MTHKWYCTCQIFYKNNHNYKCLKHLQLHETTADEEGVCDQCGHYAVAISDFEIYPRNKTRKGNSIFGYRPVSQKKEVWWQKGLTTTMRKRYFNENEELGDSRERFVDDLVEKKLKERKQ